MIRHLMERKLPKQERRQDIEDIIQDKMRAAAYKYSYGMDQDDAFQILYLDYLKKFKNTPDEWFESPSNLKVLAATFKHKLIDIYKYNKRRRSTQIHMPSSGIEEFTTQKTKGTEYQSLLGRDPMYRKGHGKEASDNPANKDEYAYHSKDKAWKPSERINSLKEMETVSTIRDMAHLVNNSYHEGSGEYMYFFGMLNIVNALHYVKDIVPPKYYKILSKVEKSGDISQDVLGIGRPGHSVYMRIARNVRELLKKHGYSI